MKISLVLAFACLGTVSSVLETEKWSNQESQNERFCGTKNYFVSTRWITCQSFWLPAVRYDIAFFDAAWACAVCSYTGVGCVACSAAAVQKWFLETADKIGGALEDMGDDVLSLAGDWLSSQWDALLSGDAVLKVVDIGAWHFEANAGVLQHCSRECEYPFGQRVCGPRTCAQHQGYIQIKAESAGYQLYLKNDCSATILVAVRYKDPMTNLWTSQCWYELSPGEGFYPSVGGVPISTRNSIWYVYARKKYDSDFEWSGTGSGSVERACSGEYLTMIRRDYVDGDGDLYSSFSCNSRRSKRFLRIPNGTKGNTADMTGYISAQTNDSSPISMGSWAVSVPGDLPEDLSLTELPLNDLIQKRAKHINKDPLCLSGPCASNATSRSHGSSGVGWNMTIYDIMSETSSQQHGKSHDSDQD